MVFWRTLPHFHLSPSLSHDPLKKSLMNSHFATSLWLIASSIAWSHLNNYTFSLKYQLHLPIMTHHFWNTSFSFTSALWVPTDLMNHLFINTCSPLNNNTFRLLYQLHLPLWLNTSEIPHCPSSLRYELPLTKWLITSSPPNYELPLSFWLITSSMPFSPLNNYTICLEYQIHLLIMNDHSIIASSSTEEIRLPSMMRHSMIIGRNLSPISSSPPPYA